jgi:hypothetical protein
VNSFINQQIGQLQEVNSAYNLLPIDIQVTLDMIALGVANKEEVEVMETKNKMVNSINSLTNEELSYLITNMSQLIQKSVQENQKIDSSNVPKDFISFLIRLYF